MAAKKASAKGLTKKIGPLPVWVWGLLAIAVGYFIYRRSSGSNPAVSSGAVDSSVPLSGNDAADSGGAVVAAPPGSVTTGGGGSTGGGSGGGGGGSDGGGSGDGGGGGVVSTLNSATLDHAHAVFDPGYTQSLSPAATYTAPSTYSNYQATQVGGGGKLVNV